MIKLVKNLRLIIQRTVAKKAYSWPAVQHGDFCTILENHRWVFTRV